MATPQMDKLMEAFTAFVADEGGDTKEAIRAFLTEATGRRVRVGTDGDGGLQVEIDEADLEPDLDMDEATAEGLRQAGLNHDLVRVAARSASFQDYVTRKARLARGRK